MYKCKLIRDIVSSTNIKKRLILINFMIIRENKRLIVRLNSLQHSYYDKVRCAETKLDRVFEKQIFLFTICSGITRPGDLTARKKQERSGADHPSSYRHQIVFYCFLAYGLDSATIQSPKLALTIWRLDRHSEDMSCSGNCQIAMGRKIFIEWLWSRLVCENQSILGIASNLQTSRRAVTHSSL